jgi:hypothetical protein
MRLTERAEPPRHHGHARRGNHRDERASGGQSGHPHIHLVYFDGVMRRDTS